MIHQNTKYITREEFNKAIQNISQKINITDNNLVKIKNIVMTIENENKIYSDMYKVNKDECLRLLQRISLIEKIHNIYPSSDLLISGM